MGGVYLDQVVHMLAQVDDERRADSLSALRRAGAPRQDRHAGLRSELGRTNGFVGRARHDDAERGDLVDRGVSRVTATTAGVE
jgi:hypothetical protein